VRAKIIYLRLKLRYLFLKRFIHKFRNALPNQELKMNGNSHIVNQPDKHGIISGQCLL
jgi:hypothetical protein